MTEGENYKNQLLALPKRLQKLNRYSDIIPCIIYLNVDTYNRCTVKPGCEEITEENYINASFVNVKIILTKGPFRNDGKMFIASQGPLANTISSFWKMIFYQEIKLIVMLCRQQENIRVS
jgi:protein tyrosine phosphatase